jgi:dephospho-CoA kinase
LASRVLVVGLTGGIAAGKSTVAAMLRDRGAWIVDADQAARAVVAPGEPGLAEVVREFGPQTLRPDGTLDRPRLAELIFGCEAARAALNALLHPRIGAEVACQVAAWDGAAEAPGVVVIEAALLFEAGWEALVDRVVGVVAKQSEQILRLMQRYGLTRARAAARVRSQLSPAGWRARCDYLIRADVSLEQTQVQVTRLWATLLREAEGKFQLAAGTATRPPAAPAGGSGGGKVAETLSGKNCSTHS